MTRTEAAHSVRERWERLGIGKPEEFPHVFSSDVDNLLEELSSTGNIFDVAPQQEQLTKAVNHEGRNAVVVGVKPGAGCGVKSPAENNSDTQQLYDNSITYGGVAVSPAAPQILDRHGDDRFADNILRALEGLPQNGDAEEEEAAAEEGALIDASGYNDPASDRSFA